MGEETTPIGEETVEVMIDGVRYVPAREIAANVNDIKEALLDCFWGEGYRGIDPTRAEEGIYIIVSDDASLDGEPFGQFIDNLISRLAERGQENAASDPTHD